MIVALSLGVAMLQTRSGQDVPLLQKVIAKWTGQNGYEELVKAAILLDTPENQDLEDYVRWREAGSPANWLNSRTGKLPAKPSNLPDNADILAVYRAQATAVEPALQLIREADTKPIFYPNKPITIITLFPEFAPLKRAAFDFARVAYDEFADGHSSAGTRALIDGLEFSRDIRAGGLVSWYVGSACQSIALRAVKDHLGQLSLDDATKLRDWASQQPAGELSQLRTALNVERAGCRATFDEYCTHPEEYLDALEAPADDQKRIAAALKATTPAWRDQFYGMIFKRFEAPWNAIIDRIKGPEEGWLEPVDNEGFDESDPLKKWNGDADVTLGMLGLIKLMNLLGGFEAPDEIGPYLERPLMQLRVLTVYADVIRFRWVNGKLPGSLAEVYGKEPNDLATGRPYTYRLVEGGSFKVFCHAPVIGDVDLFSQFPSRDDSKTPPPR